MDIANRFKGEYTLEEVVPRRDDPEIEDIEHRCTDLREIGETHYDWSLFETCGRRDSILVGIYSNVWYPLPFLDILEPQDLEERSSRR